MSRLPPSQRYHAVARALHWATAILILANLATGLLHDTLEHTVNLMPVHKSMGLTVLVLTAARIAWRLGHVPPPLPATMSLRERRAAEGVHMLLYAMMVFLPLTGWVVASAGKYPLTWFGLFAWPKLAVTKGTTLAASAHEGHQLLGWLTCALVAGHILAALRHRFLLRDDVLDRML